MRSIRLNFYNTLNDKHFTYDFYDFYTVTNVKLSTLLKNSGI